ncbi:DUF6678 family protein [Clostridium sp. UBA4548]|uniref:DUF6678 family protein n=1 Tax=Clostridium sp. UBA4548 TaxID=1946361 RepID=UPI0032E4FED7
MPFNEYQSLMNNTKWEEIRLAMYDYPLTIQWRVKNIDNGYISNWDAEWFYHFRLGGYDTIEWLEMKVHNVEMKNDIINILRRIHVAGDVLKDSIKVYGYKKDGFIDYI